MSTTPATATAQQATEPSQPIGVGSLLREFLPHRTAEDILAERIRVRLGPSEYTLPVLTIAEGEAWRALAGERLGALFGDFAKLDDPRVIIGRLSAATDLQLELLTAYDHAERLPDVATIRRTTTEGGLLKAVLAVTAAAYPLAAAAIEVLLEQPELLGSLVAEMRSQPTNTPPKPGAGRRARSAPH